MSQLASMNLTSEEQEKFLELANRAEKAKAVNQAEMFNPDETTLTDHAYLKMEERFGVRNKAVALKKVRDMVKRAVFIAEVVNDDHENRTTLLGVPYESGSVVAIHMNTEQNCVITLYKVAVATQYMPKDIKENILTMYRTQLKKHSRKEKSLLEKMDYYEAEAHAIIYPMKFLIMKTTSEKKKVDAAEKIKEAEEKLKSKKQELKDVQVRIRTVARSMLTMI